MDLQEYLRLARKRWRWIAATTALLTLAAVLVTVLTPRSYTSTAQLFVSTSGGDTTVDLAQGSTFTQNQMKTYSQVITSPKVLSPVEGKMNVSTAKDLASSITATVPANTALLNVAVTDHDAARAASVANAIANQFTTTVQDLQSVKAGQASPVKATVVAPAVAATSPTSPKPLQNIALGLVAGLLLGLALALLRDRLDTSVNTEKDVHEVSDATVIGAIPFDKNASSHPLIVREDPMSSRAEAFRTVRTNLQFVDAARHPKVMVVTSSIAGEGKSTTTANLALTLGANGSRVCVIEADLRRPKLLSYMGLEGGVGLTNVLIGEVDLDDVLQPFGGGVEVLGAGPVPPNPSELLGSERMAHVLDDLRERFDYVLVDAPPLLPVTDAAVISRLADGAVLVAGAGVVRRENIVRAIKNLEAVDANLLGVVMNRVSTSSHGGYGYYGDTYGYKSDKSVPQLVTPSEADEEQGGAHPARPSLDSTDEPQRAQKGNFEGYAPVA